MSKPESDCGREERHEHGLRHQRSEQSPPSHTQCGPHSQFPSSSERPREEEVRRIGTRRKQHQPRRAQDQEERRPGLRNKPGTARQALRGEPIQRLEACGHADGSLIGQTRIKLRRENGNLLVGLLKRHVLAQTHNWGDGAAWRQRIRAEWIERHPDIDLSHREPELCRHDPDHGVDGLVETDRAPHCGRVSSEATQPEAVAQDDNRGLRFISSEEPPLLYGDTEKRKQSDRDLRSPDRLGSLG